MINEELVKSLAKYAGATAPSESLTKEIIRRASKAKLLFDENFIESMAVLAIWDNIASEWEDIEDIEDFATEEDIEGFYENSDYIKDAYLEHLKDIAYTE